MFDSVLTHQHRVQVLRRLQQPDLPRPDTQLDVDDVVRGEVLQPHDIDFPRTRWP